MFSLCTYENQTENQLRKPCSCTVPRAFFIPKNRAGNRAETMREQFGKHRRFWIEEVNPGIFRLFQLQKFPGEKCNESDDPGVYYHDTDEWPAHAPVAMWFNGGMINDFMREWLIRMDEKRAGLISKEEYFEWKLNWPDTCDDCGKCEPKKQWR